MNNCFLGKPASSLVMAGASEDEAANAEWSSQIQLELRLLPAVIKCSMHNNEELALIAPTFMSSCCREAHIVGLSAFSSLNGIHRRQSGPVRVLFFYSNNRGLRRLIDWLGLSPHS